MTQQHLTYDDYEHARTQLINLHHTNPEHYLHAILNTTTPQAHAMLWYLIQDFDHLATFVRDEFNPTED